MYVRFDKDNSVVYVGDKKPLNTDENYRVAECDEVPAGRYDFLTVENVEEKTEVIKSVSYEDVLDENGKPTIVEVPVEETHTYLACRLVPNFAPKTEAQVKAEYEALCQKYIRQKYSATDEYKVLREYLADESKKAQFDEYNTYVEECKAKAKEQTFTE